MNKGSFRKGNRAAEKPRLCPYCDMPLKVRAYVYLDKENQKVAFKNG